MLVLQMVSPMALHGLRRSYSRSFFQEENYDGYSNYNDATAFVLAVLTFTNIVEPWHILLYI